MFADHHPGLLLQRTAPIAHNATEGDIGQMSSNSDIVSALHGNASLYFHSCQSSISPLCTGWLAMPSAESVAGPDRYANPSPGKAWELPTHRHGFMDEDLAP